MRLARYGFAIAILCFALPWLGGEIRFSGGSTTASGFEIYYGFELLKGSILLVLSLVGLVMGLIATWNVFGRQSLSILKTACVLSLICFLGGMIESMRSMVPFDVDLSIAFRMTLASIANANQYSLGRLGVLLGIVLSIVGTFVVGTGEPAEGEEPIASEPEAGSSILGLGRQARENRREPLGISGQGPGTGQPEAGRGTRAAASGPSGTQDREIPAGTMSKAGIWIGVLAATALVIVFLRVGGFGGATRSVAVQFFEDYNAGNYEKIYQTASASYRDSKKLQDFIEDMKVRKDYLGRNQDLDHPPELQHPIANGSSEGFVDFQARFEKGNAPARLQWKREGDAWKLDDLDLDVPEALLPKGQNDRKSHTDQILAQIAAGQSSRVYMEAASTLRDSISPADFKARMKELFDQVGACSTMGYHEESGAEGIKFTARLNCAKGEVRGELQYASHAGVDVLTRIQIPAPRVDTVELLGGVKLELVWVPGGTFWMGCSEGDNQCKEEEKPRHQVKVDGFWLGKYELTQGQWQAVMKGNPSEDKMFGPEHPVERVSWRDAQEFLNKAGHGLRLPTEAEWEFAARGGKESASYDVVYSIARFGYMTTAAVGTMKPNAYGLYDMLGNVSEWCQDAYREDYSSRQGVTNGSIPVEGDAHSFRVLRGGDHSDGEWHMRASERIEESPEQPSLVHSCGFRVARSGGGEPETP
jgi:formylglycine-generating enzyme required for sulfatase activity